MCTARDVQSAREKILQLVAEKYKKVNIVKTTPGSPYTTKDH